MVLSVEENDALAKVIAPYVGSIRVLWLSGTSLADPEHYNSATDGAGIHENSNWQWYPSNAMGSFENQLYGNWNNNEPNDNGGKGTLPDPIPPLRKRSHIRGQIGAGGLLRYKDK